MNESVKNFYHAHKVWFLTLFILFAFRWSFADQTRVPTGSMEPTIAVGDHLLINQMAYDLRIPFTQIKVLKTGDPQPGEIITFKPPHGPKTTYVKRLIAGPGDRVEVKNGFIKVNGQPLIQQSFKISNPEFVYQEVLNGHKCFVQRNPNFARPQEMNIIVPKNKYFFMGDNRDNSLDSRAWGYVDRSQIRARAHRVLISATFKNFIPRLDILRTLKSL